MKEEKEMKTVKFGMEITFPDEDVAQEELIQKILGDAPEFEDCVITINLESEKSRDNTQDYYNKKNEISQAHQVVPFM